MTGYPSATGVFTALKAASRAALALASLAAVLGTAATAAADEWTLDGRVVFANGSGAPYATVKFQLTSGTSVEVRTDVDGYYGFTAVDTGSSSYGVLTGLYGACASSPQQLMDRDVTSTLTLPGNPGEC